MIHPFSHGNTTCIKWISACHSTDLLQALPHHFHSSHSGLRASAIFGTYLGAFLLLRSIVAHTMSNSFSNVNLFSKYFILCLLINKLQLCKFYTNCYLARLIGFDEIDVLRACRKIRAIHPEYTARRYSHQPSIGWHAPPAFV
jgi:hypothetical protein